MTLDQIANIAEITGVVIVVITLIYLSVQLHQNTQALNSSSAQATHDALTNGYLTLATDSDLNRIFRNGSQDPSTLTDDEMGQFFAFWSATMFITQNCLYQTRSGALDEELMNTWLLGLRNTVHLPGFQYFWKQRNFVFSGDMQKYVEDVLARPPERLGHRALGPSAK